MTMGDLKYNLPFIFLTGVSIMRKLFLILLTVVELFRLETRCDMALPLARPIPQEVEDETPLDQPATLEFVTQVFAVYIDQNLLPSYKKGLDRKHYVYEIAKAAAEIEVNDFGMGCWILAIAKKESNFRIRANRRSTAKGLCQVIPKYHEKTLKAYNITKEDLLNSPTKSLQAGYAVLKTYFKRTPNDYTKAIFRYRGWGSKGLKFETCQAYFKEVESEYATLFMRVYT